MTDQEDGAYPRINGAMLQSQQYTGMLVSAVGKVTGHNTLLAADGVTISLDTDAIAEALIVNPGVAVEIIGVANDATTIQVRGMIVVATAADTAAPTISSFVVPSSSHVLVVDRSALGICFSQSWSRPRYGCLQQDDRDPIVSSICSLLPSTHGFQLGSHRLYERRCSRWCARQRGDRFDFAC